MPESSPQTNLRKIHTKKPSSPSRKTPDALAPSGGDEDLPILTEIIAPETHTVRGPSVDATQFRAMTDEIVESVKKRFSYELPTLLEAVLLKTTEDLESGIATIIETAARDLAAKKFGGDADISPF